jgi:hypothetical protein
MKSIRNGAKEKPVSVAGLRQVLEVKAGIDLRVCNNKSVENLFSELVSGMCELKWRAGAHGKLSLLRSACLVCVKIRANTRKGPMYLKHAGAADLGTNRELWKLRDPTREVGKRDDVGHEISELLRTELNLDDEWRRQNLVLEKMETTKFREDAHSTSLPGLCTHFRQTMACYIVKDPEAPAVHGRIGLPDGCDFNCTEAALLSNGSRTTWTWVAESENPGAPNPQGTDEPQSPCGSDMDDCSDDSDDGSDMEDCSP